MPPTLTAPPPRVDDAGALPSRTKAYILAGVLVSLFLAALDQTIVATALPAIVADLAGIRLLAWVSTGYLVASTAMVPVYGKLSDQYGRRSIVLFGIGVFLAGSALCGVAASMPQLIVFRVVQGIGAAALTSSAFAVPADLYAPAERARYQGLFGAVFALSSVIGPTLGGFLTDALSWRWVFYVNVPFGALALLLIITKMPRLGGGIRLPVDWAGTALLIAAVVPLLLALSLDKTVAAWTSPLVVGLLAASALSTVLFLAVEYRVPSPVLPLELFGIRTIAVVAAASVFMGGAFMGAVFFLSLFMVNVVGVSATVAGSTLIPLTFAVVIGAMTSSLIVHRVGRYKLVMLAGTAVAIGGFALLARMDPSVTQWDVTWRMIVLGVGLGPAMPLLTLVVQNAAPVGKVGAATAVRQFFMQIGGAVAIAVFGAVLASVLTAELQSGISRVASELPPAAVRQLDLRAVTGRGEAPADLTALPPELRDVVRGAFAAAVTRIYAYAGLMLAAGLIILLALPEIPLRGTAKAPSGPPPPGLRDPLD